MVGGWDCMPGRVWGGPRGESHVRVLYPLLDAEMMQCCEELHGFPRDAGRVPRIPRPVPRQRATREAGGRGVLPDPSFFNSQGPLADQVVCRVLPSTL